MRTPTLGVAIGVAAAHVFFAAAAAHADVVHLATRPGVTQPLRVEPAADTRAVAILFAGGHGGVRFGGDGEPQTLRGNFLLRSRALFHTHGVATATFGAPSDRARQPFLDDAFRLSDEHATDVGAVVEEMRRRFRVPVFLVGTSRGTLSAAAAALKLGGRAAAAPDGVVLTAAMTSLVDQRIDAFAMPVLLVGHRLDTCRATDYRDLPRLAGRLRAPRHEVLTFGGGRSDGPPCEAFAYHGFNGIEDEAVAAIARWMLASK
jgi:alkylated DNA nucleotide flippase Atl1